MKQLEEEEEEGGRRCSSCPLLPQGCVSQLIPEAPSGASETPFQAAPGRSG